MNCSRTKFVTIIVNVLVFYAFFLPDRFCAFLLKHSLTSQVTFSRFRSLFLSGLYCSHSEVKIVAEIKSIAAWQQEGHDSLVDSASGEESVRIPDWLKIFAPIKNLSRLLPLNCLALEIVVRGQFFRH